MMSPTYPTVDFSELRIPASRRVWGKTRVSRRRCSQRVAVSRARKMTTANIRSVIDSRKEPTRNPSTAVASPALMSAQANPQLASSATIATIAISVSMATTSQNRSIVLPSRSVSPAAAAAASRRARARMTVSRATPCAIAARPSTTTVFTRLIAR